MIYLEYTLPVMIKTSTKIKQIFDVFLMRHKIREEEFINKFPMKVCLMNKENIHHVLFDILSITLVTTKTEGEIDIFINEKK